jgi:hypothetical protein
MAQQQGSSQPTLWQENSTPPQILSKPATATQQQQKLLWPYSLQQQQEQPASNSDSNTSIQSSRDGGSPGKVDGSPGKVGQQPSQQTTEGQRSQPLEKPTQNPFNMNIPSDIR